jgi:hypothetical protein
MADYGAIRDGLKTRLETISALAVVYDTVPDRVIVPSAVIAPGSPVADYHESGSDSAPLTRFNFSVVVLVQHWEPNAAQDVVDAMISGSASVFTAIEGDKTLGGVASTCQVTRCLDYGRIPVADSEYSGARFQVEVFAV